MITKAAPFFPNVFCLPVSATAAAGSAFQPVQVTSARANASHFLSPDSIWQWASRCYNASDKDDPGLWNRVASIFGSKNAPSGSGQVPPIGHDPRHPYAQGTKIGPWVIERELGKGGMARVFECYREELDTLKAAVKVIDYSRNKYPDTEERFRREARALSALDHPSIVPILDFGRDKQRGQEFYLAMKYIQGKSLAEIMQNKLQHKKIVQIMTELAGGLEHAHTRGIFHRDVKPTNVMIGRDGRACWIDFGVARQTDLKTLTVGEILGTPSYMPPEALAGRLYEHYTPARADIYALGLILWELFSNQKAYPIKKELNELANISQITLAKSQAKPFGLTGDFSNALKELVQAATHPDPRSRPNISVFLAVLKSETKSEASVSKGTGPHSGKKDLASDPITAPVPEPADHGPAEPKNRLEEREKNESQPRIIGAITEPNNPKVIDAAEQGDAEAMKRVVEMERKAFQRKIIGSITEPNNSKVIEALNRFLPDISHLPDWLRSYFVAIPAGEFEMNFTKNESWQLPVNRVLVSAFYMMKVPVFNKFYKQVTGSNSPSGPGFDGPKQPVVNINYHEAGGFAQTLTDKFGKGKVVFRLPTDAEWEIAGRGPNDKSYGPNYGRICLEERTCVSDSGNTTEVGIYPANDFGLYDLDSNVIEWCLDWFGYYKQGFMINPMGPASGDCRVFRGGYWDMHGVSFHSSHRGGAYPHRRDDFIGFRLVAVTPDRHSY